MTLLCSGPNTPPSAWCPLSTVPACSTLAMVTSGHGSSLDTTDQPQLSLPGQHSPLLWSWTPGHLQTSSWLPDPSSHNNTARPVWTRACTPSSHSQLQHVDSGQACQVGPDWPGLVRTQAMMDNNLLIVDTKSHYNQFLEQPRRR